MSKVFASLGMSLDGFIAGPNSRPDNPLSSRAGAYIMGHTRREPWVRQGGTTFTFVTEGIDTALARARKAAGDEDVQISGGADTVRQSINAPDRWTNSGFT
ncbi:hypothetical protein [Streptomyces sp. NPDC002779]|uniref:hypothetical protein n=1 Tax=Streptomyces sp. NPDC002779 TaxID=3364664 RepID=UPI0036C976D0